MFPDESSTCGYCYFGQSTPTSTHSTLYSPNVTVVFNPAQQQRFSRRWPVANTLAIDGWLDIKNILLKPNPEKNPKQRNLLASMQEHLLCVNAAGSLI